MRMSSDQFLLIFFMSLTLSLRGQAGYSKYGDSLNYYGQVNTAARATNGGTPVSNYQQLRDFQKSETDRMIAQKLEKQTQAPNREMKEREMQVKLARLKLDEQNEEKKKQELEQQAEKKELQQQLLRKYMQQLYKQAPDKESCTPQGAVKASTPAPAPEKKSKSVQEAMKMEPPN